MTRRVPPVSVNEDIARMLAEGASKLAIKKALGVGIKRINAVMAGDMSIGAVTEHAEVEAGDVVFGEPEAPTPDTVTVGADYLRALEALLFVVEQNRALRAAMEAA